MAQTAPLADRGPSLASNNPFRNRTTSPGLAPFNAAATNPFLDTSETMSDGRLPHAGNNGMKKTRETDQTADAFASLDLNDPSRGAQKLPVNGPPRRENIAPRPYQRGPPGRHRPTNSDEERRRQQAKPRDLLGDLNIFADPPESRSRDKRTQRRNSESSVRDKPKDLDPEAEKRRKERRLREGKTSQKSKKPDRKLDVIDKLDVTSIYGTGLFHHDGPFDACNPHRNRKGTRQAPMQAFPKDSVNMQLGGAGPLNSKLNLDQYHGRGQEAHVDYNEAAVVDDDADYLRRPQPDRAASFNPLARTEPVHGYETAGLGTSTFLEGAPASRAAMQRRESENEAAQQVNANGGLSRKKSLAQRIKGVRPRMGDNGRMTSPEPLGTPTSPLGTGRSEQNGVNPFFKEYDREYEKKGAQIAFAEEQKPNRARAPSSPKRSFGLERKVTSESIGAEEGKTGGGFLSRVKSLKGGRSRPLARERRNTETAA
ncbi:Pal1 cell morphology protein-domain-containing protein [Exophiala viscosa]|uniref:Pal1 cell morphology protein-domain-containing protein n=1 Tax=Exophiala viscosa TaxID=2486360 RepID=A0AAN6E4K2_9EURO|nr:Pal1 cell morphology protein-domain-containing protein [Exophiala viscosa]